MSRKQFTGPKLPGVLLKQVDPNAGAHKKLRFHQSRKDQRKYERKEKKQNRSRSHAQHHRVSDDEFDSEDDVPQSKKIKTAPIQIKPATKPLKSILKRPVQQQSETEGEEDEDEEDEDENSFNDFTDEEVIEPRASKKQKLSREDIEIAALEKKLGIKGKKSKASEDDGLDWLVDGSDSDGGVTGGTKRKREEDEEWLRSKRLQTSVKLKSKLPVSATDDVPSDEDEDDEDKGVEDGDLEADDEDANDIDEVGTEDEVDSDMDGLQNPFSDDELSSDDLLSDDGPPKPVKKRVRENPYVAPVSASTTKYVPPSMRKAMLSSTEDLTALKRQIQGQMNRLSEANFLTILDAIQGIAEKNPRQHVFTVLTDLLHGLIASPSTLNETFLILHAGFTTAIFKVMGVELGATLLEKIVDSIVSFQNRGTPGKEVLNLIGFLSNLYVFQMVGATIIFDYIRQLLGLLSEDNTELLLRIIRTAGMQLRQDDPTSLKDIVVLLTRSVAAQGEQNLSVRTKFMIETITDLKNNRMKTGINANAIVSEHTIRVKKIVGSLNTRTLRASEPLQISLRDIQDSEKKGKWWLVGASYLDPAKMNASQTANTSTTAAIDDGYESETPGHVNLTKLARSQGMNTDVRRAIFIAIMSATDFRDAHVRIMKLNLKNKQAVEIPRVLLQCAGAEQVHNPYYTIIAEKLCSEAKLQKIFRSALWDMLRKMEINNEAEDMSSSEIVNTARLFATLIAAQQIQISALKTVDFTYLDGPLLTFIEVLLTSLILRIDKIHKEKFEEQIKNVFSKASAASGMIQGLRLFFENTVSKAEITNGAQERKVVRRGSALAMRALDQAATVVGEEDSDDSSD